MIFSLRAPTDEPELTLPVLLELVVSGAALIRSETFSQRLEHSGWTDDFG
jgi:hypothetical protein